MQTAHLRFLLSSAAVLLGLLATLLQAPEVEAPPTLTGGPARHPGGPDSALRLLHRALALRSAPDGSELGLEEPDLLLWPDSRHLLSLERFTELTAALAAAAAEGPPEDPLQAVLLQQDLWAAFDWAVQPDSGLSDADAARRKQLADALARTLARLAPSPAALASVGDNLAAADAAWTLRREPDPERPQEPFLPAGLADPQGEWVLLTYSGAAGAPLAEQHAYAHAGRSAFEVRLRVPGGRKAALRLLEDLRSRPWTRACKEASCDPGRVARPHEHLSRDLPVLPAGCAVALVRRVLAVDSSGNLHATALVKSVQVRVFLEPGEAVSEPAAEPPPGWPWQAVSELVLDRARLLAGEQGGLVPIAPGQHTFEFLGAHGDEVELLGRWQRTPHLDSCVGCHGSEGLASVNSFTGMSSGPGSQLLMSLRSPPRSLAAAEPASLAHSAMAWKQARPDWAALQAAAWPR